MLLSGKRLENKPKLDMLYGFLKENKANKSNLVSAIRQIEEYRQDRDLASDDLFQKQLDVLEARALMQHDTLKEEEKAEKIFRRILQELEPEMQNYKYKKLCEQTEGGLATLGRKRASRKYQEGKHQAAMDMLSSQLDKKYSPYLRGLAHCDIARVWCKQGLFNEAGQALMEAESCLVQPGGDKVDLRKRIQTRRDEIRCAQADACTMSKVSLACTVDQARQLEKEGQIESAIEMLDKIIVAEDYDVGLARIALGYIFLKREKDFVKAHLKFNEVEQSSKNYWNAQIGICKTLVEELGHEAAIEKYNELLLMTSPERPLYWKLQIVNKLSISYMETDEKRLVISLIEQYESSFIFCKHIKNKDQVGENGPILVVVSKLYFRLYLATDCVANQRIQLGKALEIADLLYYANKSPEKSEWYANCLSAKAKLCEHSGERAKLNIKIKEVCPWRFDMLHGDGVTVTGGSSSGRGERLGENRVATGRPLRQEITFLDYYTPARRRAQLGDDNNEPRTAGDSASMAELASPDQNGHVASMDELAQVTPAATPAPAPSPAPESERKVFGRLVNGAREKRLPQENNGLYGMFSGLVVVGEQLVSDDEVDTQPPGASNVEPSESPPRRAGKGKRRRRSRNPENLGDKQNKEPSFFSSNVQPLVSGDEVDTQPPGVTKSSLALLGVVLFIAVVCYELWYSPDVGIANGINESQSLRPTF